MNCEGSTRGADFLITTRAESLYPFMKALMNRRMLASSLFSLVACGSVDTVEQPDPIDPGDTTSPTVLEATPAPDDKGVPADAAIVVVFSEPMDRGSVEAAYSSASLPSDAVSMSWNAAGDTLTIRPDHPLEIAEGIGTDPTQTSAKQYVMAVAATATDLAGNPLAARLDLAFTTQKRLSASIDMIADLTRYRSSLGGVGAVGTDLKVGDNGTTVTYRGFVSFDLTPLPTGIESESATLGVRQTAVNGTPFDLGALATMHLVYTAVDSAAWGMQGLGTLGALTSTVDLGPRSIDASAAVAEDVAERATRANRTQYRFEFDAANNGDGDADNVELGAATFSMSVVYLAP